MTRMSTTTELLTAKAELQRVTTELAALRGGVEALAGEWHVASGLGIEGCLADCREELLILLGADR